MQEKGQNIAPIKERILYFVNTQGYKKTEFYEKTGISASNFKASGLGSEIGGVQLVKILTYYKELNANWLLTGEGDMLETHTPYTSNNTPPRKVEESPGPYSTKYVDLLEKLAKTKGKLIEQLEHVITLQNENLELKNQIKKLEK